MLLDLGTALLRRLPAEPAHLAGLRLAGLADAVLPHARPADPVLASTVLGLAFPNPLGLAAGFDKNGQVPTAMLHRGFGHVEIGTVTPRPQAGNPKPRLFRLPEDGAIVNRMGFNNTGMAAMAARLARRRPAGIVGINIGANKDSADRIADYAAGFTRLARFASYVAVNISSPNTPGLRGLQNRGELTALLASVTAARAASGLAVPLLLKIAPDIDEAAMDAIAEVSLGAGIDGLIISNTTIARPKSLINPHAKEMGGLSGTPLLAPSTGVLRGMRKRVGTKLVLIGVGGITSGADALAKIRAGASLVQLYTAMVLQGPGLIGRVNSELAALLRRDGFSSLAQAVGADFP